MLTIMLPRQTFVSVLCVVVPSNLNVTRPFRDDTQTFSRGYTGSQHTSVFFVLPTFHCGACLLKKIKSAVATLEGPCAQQYNTLGCSLFVLLLVLPIFPTSRPVTNTSYAITLERRLQRDALTSKSSTSMCYAEDQ